MAQNLFPKLRGLTWSVHKRPVASTRVVVHVSGREVREQQYKYPLYEFDLSFSALSSEKQAGPLTQGMGERSLQALEAHYLSNAGAFGTFPFRYADASADEDDSTILGQQIGVGDGAQTAFTIMRQVAPPGIAPPYLEPVGQVEELGLNVYIDGTVQLASAYNITFPNKVTFVSAPAAGTIISADCTFYYLCRYKDDQLDFEQIYKSIHRVQTVTLRTVKYP